MDSSTLLLVLVALALGVVIGTLLTRSLHPHEKQRKELEERLDKLQDEHKEYQHKVTEHFLTTSSLVNTMTESYRDLHEHLASSAMHLTNPEISRQLIDAGYGRISSNLASDALANSIASEVPEPPRDYAPKVPGGVLSEDYGLRNEDNVPPNPSGSAKDADSDGDDLDDDPTLKVG